MGKFTQKDLNAMIEEAMAWEPAQTAQPDRQALLQRLLGTAGTPTPVGKFTETYQTPKNGSAMRNV